MSDNEFALSTFVESGNLAALRAHVESSTFVGDDDAGWEIVRILRASDC